jgi:hypothetical protein
MNEETVKKSLRPFLIKYCIFLSIFLLPLIASGQEAGNKKFKDFINDATDGSWFDRPILLKNECDFSLCTTWDCGRQLFIETISRQEYDYVRSQYGTRGKDWDVTGQDSVSVYELANERYFDDLGIQIFSTGEKKVLHFEITSSAEALKDFEYNLR